MSRKGERLHIFIFPLMAAGHLLPAVDIAKLFASSGVKVSIITTAGSATAVEESIRVCTEASLLVRILLVEWPSPTIDLPDTLSSLSSPDQQMDIVLSTFSLRPSFENLVRMHRPDAIISDAFFPWTAELGVLRLIFHGTSFFSLCLSRILDFRDLADSGDSFVVPGIPHRIELHRSQVFDQNKIRPELAAMVVEIKEAEEKSYGVVVNSFYELEPDYADHFSQVMKCKAWHIGPVSLVNEDAIVGSVRGGECDTDWGSLASWLDSKAASSVLYVCFGSLSRFTEPQIREIAEGLDSSGYCFIWVGKETAQWLPKGFTERIVDSGKGIVVHGWAPQVLILSHGAVGGFVTHCGWNSSLESLCNAVPVVTWPMFADQFHNERLLVDVLKVGVEIGVKTFALREEERELVKAEKIAEAVCRLMGDDLEAKERRERAKELKAAARRALEEGGSSRSDLRCLIQDLIERKTEFYHLES